MKNSSASSSNHSPDPSHLDMSTTSKHDVENLFPVEKETDVEKDTAPKDPNIVDWDGPDDVCVKTHFVVHTPTDSHIA
jgi:hypothetical protein